MAKLSQRFFALFFAVLFLVTSSSIAIAFILSNIQSKNTKPPTQTNSQTAASKTTASATSTDKLAGTMLANFTPVASVSKLETTDTTVGNGAVVKAGDTITVDYTGAIASTGIIFQSSLDGGKPVTLSLSQVIQGWAEGIPGMKVGGTRQLLIPANLAYGANPPSGIPVNAALVFVVTVHSISGQ